jgi:hypothetical protein
VTASDSAPLRAPLAALGLAAALAVALAFMARAVNRPPVILRWEAEPSHVARHGGATLRVVATDADGQPLRYAFAAERGRLSSDPSRPDTARYVPPVDGGTVDRLTVTVMDTRGATATATTSVTTDAVAVSSPMATPTPASMPAVAFIPTPTARARPLPTREAAVLVPSPIAAAPAPGATPTSMAPAGRNHAPVLDKGATLEGVGTRSVLLVANGYEPDGDPVEYEWDAKGCFEILNQSQTTAEVKFGYCTWGVIRLTWKDPQGLSAFAEWTLSK